MRYDHAATLDDVEIELRVDADGDGASHAGLARRRGTVEAQRRHEAPCPQRNLNGCGARSFFGAEGGAIAVEIDARDRFLFSVSMGAGVISAFRIDPATGDLRPGNRTTLDPGRRSEFHLVAIANVR